MIFNSPIDARMVRLLRAVAIVLEVARQMVMAQARRTSGSGPADTGRANREPLDELKTKRLLHSRSRDTWLRRELE